MHTQTRHHVAPVTLSPPLPAMPRRLYDPLADVPLAVVCSWAKGRKT
jgi:hypothetical protein